MNKPMFLKAVFDHYHIPCSEEQLKLFLRYEELLVEWNERFNLTTITDFPAICFKHFADSVYVITIDQADSKSEIGSYFRPEVGSDFKSEIGSDPVFKKEVEVLDAGTGPGFPGLPLAILKPELNFTLLEATGKKISFLKEVVSQLDLSNVRVLQGRAEEYGRNPLFRNHFDLVVSRAMAKLPITMEFCTPFVKPHGIFIAYVGSNLVPSDQESLPEFISALDQVGKKLGVGVRSEFLQYQLSDGNECNADSLKDISFHCYMDHYCIFFDKLHSTPENYPRSNAQALKKPLSVLGL